MGYQLNYIMNGFSFCTDVRDHASSWEWYCYGEAGVFPTLLAKFITGWLPSLLLTLWQVSVVTLCCCCCCCC